MSKQVKNKSGFTLVEMMVAVAIFVIVALVISGAYITLADIFRKVQSNRAIIDNLNFAMDTMTLQIREGVNYEFSGNDCGANCYTNITFTELTSVDNQITQSRDITYTLTGMRITQSIDEGAPSYLTAREIEINGLRFYDQRTIPRRVLISIDGTAINKEGLESDFTLQTVLSQRNNDI